MCGIVCGKKGKERAFARRAACNDEVVYYYIIHCRRARVRARHSSMIIFHIKVISGLDNK